MQLDEPHTERSVFGEILDWMLFPLVVVWPLSVGVTYFAANAIADPPYDLILGDSVTALSRYVKIGADRVTLQIPESARELLHEDEIDAFYFQVRDSSGRVVAGTDELPALVLSEPVQPFVTLYRDYYLHNEDVRIAYRIVETGKGNTRAVVQVAETRRKRANLASEIVRGVILPQFVVVPIALLLVWIGLNKGIAPLKRLQEEIQVRGREDLSPIDEQETPEETRPLIRAFNALLDKLRQNMAAQSRFIADAAHQMRTPIAGLKTQTQLALRATSPDDVRRALGQIDASVNRSAHLINQLLSLARADASQRDAPELAPVDLARLARDVTADWVDSARDKRIDLGLESPDQMVSVAGNGFLLRELLQNLIDNALRYTPQGGEVTVRIAASPEVTLEVEDTGVGIAEKDRALVFEPFYRVLGNNVEGTGLGLAIVRGIAESHRAQVSLHTGRSGRGTLVRVIFPDASSLLGSRYSNAPLQ